MNSFDLLESLSDISDYELEALELRLEKRKSKILYLKKYVKVACFSLLFVIFSGICVLAYNYYSGIWRKNEIVEKELEEESGVAEDFEQGVHLEEGYVTKFEITEYDLPEGYNGCCNGFVMVNISTSPKIYEFKDGGIRSVEGEKYKVKLNYKGEEKNVTFDMVKNGDRICTYNYGTDITSEDRLAIQIYNHIYNEKYVVITISEGSQSEYKEIDYLADLEILEAEEIFEGFNSVKWSEFGNDLGKAVIGTNEGVYLYDIKNKKSEKLQGTYGRVLTNGNVLLFNQENETEVTISVLDEKMNTVYEKSTNYYNPNLKAEDGIIVASIDRIIEKTSKSCSVIDLSLDDPTEKEITNFELENGEDFLADFNYNSDFAMVVGGENLTIIDLGNGKVKGKYDISKKGYVVNRVGWLKDDEMYVEYAENEEGKATKIRVFGE